MAMQLLPEQEAIGRIFETVELADAGSAPFVLVLGSGFSHGLVPTAKEVVTESLPLWMYCQKSKECFETARDKSPAEKTAIARAFWKRMAEGMPKDSALSLESVTGMPANYADAYRAAFDPRFAGAVGEPAQARKFQRALMRLDDLRLNAAHFLLASMLGVQPGKTRESKLFKTKAAFSRLLLTTNFDPFLQTALQLVSRLYFMSDTPDLGMGDEIYDDATDSVHLVYVHGSIHRRSQAATDQQIAALKEKNARTLAPVLKRHGVIVLGYSGWDDAIVEALATCESFDHRLYWCGLEADPAAPGAFGPRVAEILRKPSAFYVPITGAGRFMARLCNHLVEGLPRLLSNPIGQLRELLDFIDLKELEAVKAKDASASQILDGSAEAQAFVRAKQSTLVRLQLAEQAFHGSVAPMASSSSPETTEHSPSMIETATVSAAGAQKLLASARLAGNLENYPEALRLCDEALALPNLMTSDQAEILVYRGEARYSAEDPDGAIEDWTAVADLPEGPVAQIAQALYNRGFTWGQKGEHDRALADLSRVIDQLPGAPVEQIAQALNNRGFTWAQKGEHDKALADYSRVIDQLPGAPVEDIAQVLNNRGFTWGQKGQHDKALADYSWIIDQLPGAPVEQIAKALYNRGVTWGQKGEHDRALADYSRVIDQLPGAPVEQIARAMANRGWIHYQGRNFSAFLADTEKALTRSPDLDFAQFNLGLGMLACGRDADALEAYRRAGEQHPHSIQRLGLVDLAEAQKTWLTPERAEPVVRLLQGLRK
jgi:tetratricopeptide (TPR) repeat protein